MPLEAKDIPALLEYIGADATKIDTIDQFKAAHDGAFILKTNAEKDPEIIGKITGKRIGSIQTKVVAGLKSLGVDFATEEIKDKGVEDILQLGLTKVTELSTKALDNLKKELGTKPNEQVKEWETKYGQLETKLKDTEGLLGKTKDEFTGFKTQVETEKKTGKVKSFVEGAWKDFKWANGVNDLVKKGFMATVSENYQVQLDEKDEPFVADAKGERIKSSKKSGEFKSFNEVLEEEGVKAKVYAIAPASKTPAYTPPAAGGQGGNGNAGGAAGANTGGNVYVHPNAAKYGG